MKLSYRQKLYISVLTLFLVFVNGSMFVITAIQGNKSIKTRKENFLVQNNMILQAMLTDIEPVYSSRPQGIPLILKQHGIRRQRNGIFIQVDKANSEDDDAREYIYSSFNYETIQSKARDTTINAIRKIDGQRYFMVAAFLPSPFDNYHVVTVFSIQSVYEDWHSTVRLLMVLSVIFSSVIAVVLYALIYYITRPLEDISDAAVKFGNGDYQARINNTSDDELGQTARNFNVMADRITYQFDQLETMVADKQRLIDDISHEMRTPLTAIRGYVSYLQSAKIDEKEYFDTLNIIDRQAERMQKLSEGVLSFTRLNNQETDRTTPVQLCVLLADIQKSYKVKSDMYNITFNVNCPQGITIYGEKLLYESLIGNLIDNAFNACLDTATRRVDVNVQQGENLTVKIADTGIGMSPQTLENIYKPFFRADKSRSRKQGGAGLGAALCKEIADIYGIQIDYQSQLGAGTTVTLNFTT